MFIFAVIPKRRTMVSISEIKASNIRLTKDTAPHTAVLTGATDGIGKATLIRLISTKLPVKVYVIGRNGDRHRAFLDRLRETNKQANIIWLEGQLSLLADARRLCDEIKARETYIDTLYMSAGFISSGERIGTQLSQAHRRHTLIATRNIGRQLTLTVSHLLQPSIDNYPHATPAERVAK